MRDPMADERTLAERLLAGDKRALARGISLVEDDDPEGWALVREVYPHTGLRRGRRLHRPARRGQVDADRRARAPPARARADRSRVLSIDPSSPFRGGALLGDRIRLTEHFLDPGVFIRSMATRGALGGLAEAALQAALLMDAAGKDDVLLETVGVGQAEVDVIDHADSVVLVLIPGSGDSIQALKAGVMEIPDIIVVNKADHPMTDTMVREIRGVLSLAPAEGGWVVPIVKTEAVARRGRRGPRRAARRAPRVRRGRGAAVRAAAAQPLSTRCSAWRRCGCGAELEASLREDPEIQGLLDEVVARRLDPASAAARCSRAARAPDRARVVSSRSRA